MHNSLIRIVDDDLDLLDGLSYMLESEGYRSITYPNASSFLSLDDPQAPGCILLDYVMPDINGIDLQKMLVKKGFSQPVIFLTAHADVDMAIEVFRSGASNVLKKPVVATELFRSIECAIKKDFQNRESNTQRSNTINSLTSREKQILSLVAKGLTNSQVAERLQLSERTIEVHRLNGYRKLGIHTINELNAFLKNLQ